MNPLAARLMFAPLEIFLRAVPDRVHTTVVAFAVDRTLAAQQQRADLEPLEGRSIALEVTDTNSRWAFRVEGERLRAAPPSTIADVVIRGRLADFVALALRAEDPDTLFFQRRLAIEGDTEAGLLVKYLIDGFEVDWEAQAGALIGAERAARAHRLASRVGLDTGCARAAERVNAVLAAAAEQRTAGG